MGLNEEALERATLEALVAEMQRRREADPLRSFNPTPPQRRFLRSVLYGEHRENYYFGANRSGKTLALAYIAAHLARFGFPDDSPLAARYVRGADSEVSVRDRATAGWLSSLDFPMSRDVLQPYVFSNGYGAPGHLPFIPDWEIDDWSVSNQVLRLKNGSIIGFKSADSGRKKFQGAAKDWIGFDEEHPESITDEATIRVGRRALHLFTAATLLPPEGTIGGVSWLYPKVIVPWKKGELPHVGIYTSSIYENPYIPKEEIDRLEAKYAEGSMQRRIRLLGELLPGLSGARLYSSFRMETNVRKQTEILPYAPLALCWDFNVEPMPCIIGQRLGGVFKVFKELILEEGNISEMVDMIRQNYPHHQGEIHLYGDATGHARASQTAKSNWSVVMQHLVGYPSPIRLRVPYINPDVSLRINSVNMACRGPDGVSRLEVDPSCEELIADMDSVVSDGRGGIKKSRRRGDPYYRRTHASDALGYWVTYDAPAGSTASLEVPRWGGTGGPRGVGSAAGLQIARPGYRWGSG